MTEQGETMDYSVVLHRPRLLDLFCGAGGSAMGYYRVGFEVVGVDIKPQPHYPFEFHQADALTYPLEGFDAYHASPPCQGVSIMRNLPWLRNKEYQVLIADIRERFEQLGKPYVIENVATAKYGSKMLEKLGLQKHGMQAGFLCGQMFGLPIYRHRLFETNFPWFQPEHPKHRGHIRTGRNIGDRARNIVVRKTGQTYGFDKPSCAVGHAVIGGMSPRDALGCQWMNRDEACQAIPPAYTQYIGVRLYEAAKALQKRI